MIHIYTRSNNIFSIEFIKWKINSLFGIKRGPNSVLESLERGLQLKEIPYSINSYSGLIKQNDIVHVLSGIKVLQDAIVWKKKGLISKLVVGPNLVVTPNDNESIISDEAIDIILQPSQWVKDFFISVVPELANKIHIWPAGVEIPHNSNITKTNECILFKKNVEEDVYHFLKEKLIERNINFIEIKYGSYNRKKFLKLLECSQYMIYLQNSESQGIALQEAWIHNVPTLVWCKGEWKYRDYKWEDPKISAPYLTDSCGYFFSGDEDFENVFDKFLNNLKIFNSKNYVSEHLTDKKSIEIYLNSINRK